MKIDGQVKTEEDVKELLSKYPSVTDQRKTFARQLKFYRSLKVPGVPPQKFFITSQGKSLSTETLEDNLLFIISSWNAAMPGGDGNGAISAEEHQSTPNIQSTSENIQTLKRKLQDEAETERLKKAKKIQEIKFRKGVRFSRRFRNRQADPASL